MHLEPYLRLMAEKGASDIFFSVGARPAVKVEGRSIAVGQEPLDADALHAIARKAIERDVGARALRSVVEDIMLNIMYDLPEHKEEGAVYEITPEMVTGEVDATLFIARDVKRESA